MRTETVTCDKCEAEIDLKINKNLYMISVVEGDITILDLELCAACAVKFLESTKIGVELFKKRRTNTARLPRRKK
jgi:hypothetical protein